MIARAVIAGAALVGAAALAGAGWAHRARVGDAREAEAAWAVLEATATPAPHRFDPVMVAALPEPARRYFAFAIAPGTPLKTVAVIEMSGQFGLGDARRPNDLPMQARQILAPPHGFVWIARFGSGPMRMAGSDGLVGDRAWTRFWLLGLAPLARAAGGTDLARSARGRLIGEALWAPAALLPQEGVRWAAVDADTARAHLTIAGEAHAFDLTVDADGRPLSLVLQRWSNANPEKVFRSQPFGARFGAVRTFEGFTVPVEIEAGNLFGTPQYFAFFKAQVRTVTWR